MRAPSFSSLSTNCSDSSNMMCLWPFCDARFDCELHGTTSTLKYGPEKLDRSTETVALGVGWRIEPTKRRPISWVSRGLCLSCVTQILNKRTGNANKVLHRPWWNLFRSIDKDIIAASSCYRKLILRCVCNDRLCESFMLLSKQPCQLLIVAGIRCGVTSGKNLLGLSEIH
jgi:hypothetical protein